MYKIFLITGLIFFSLNSQALVSVKTDSGKIISSENLSLNFYQGRILIGDRMSSTSFEISGSAIKDSGFHSATEMFQLIGRAKEVTQRTFILDCTLEASNTVSTCFFE